MKKLQVSDLPSLSEGVKRSICDGVYGFFWGEVEGFSEEHYILQVTFLNNSELIIIFIVVLHLN